MGIAGNRGQSQKDIEIKLSLDFVNFSHILTHRPCETWMLGLLTPLTSIW